MCGTFKSKRGEVHSGRPENEISKKITYYVFGKSVCRVCDVVFGFWGETEHMYMYIVCVSIRITQEKTSSSCGWKRLFECFWTNCSSIMTLPSTCTVCTCKTFLPSFLIQVHNFIQLKNIFEDVDCLSTYLNNRLSILSIYRLSILKTNAIQGHNYKFEKKHNLRNTYIFVKYI